MKLTGCFLLLCGWLIVLAALLLLGQPGERLSFVTAGMAIEILGLVLLAQKHVATQRDAFNQSAMQEEQA